MKLSKITPSTKKIFFFFCFLSSTLFSSAQVSTSSPYSRYGIGDLESTSLTKNLGMGGTEIAITHPLFINSGNPASYADLFLTSFDVGLKFNQYKLSTAKSSQNTNVASLSYFQFAFPIIPFKWSLGFGLQPYSNVGYSIVENTTTPFGDAEKRSYKGSGGLNSFHIGTGKKFGKHLSLGVNIEYIFGVVDHNKSIEFTSPYYMNAFDNRSTAIGWFHYNFGMQYTVDSLRLAKSDSIVMFDKKIKVLSDSLSHILSGPSTPDYDAKNILNQEIAQTKDLRNKVLVKKKKSDWRLTLGLIGSPVANLNARETRVVASYRFYNYALPDQILMRDTAIYSTSDQKKVTLPMSVGIGAALKKGTRWTFAGDYSIQQWSDFKFLDVKDSLFDSWKAAVGIQYIPNDRALRGYSHFISYRLGFHYQQTFLNVGTEKINDVGLSFGLGLPIGKAATNIHFSVEVGKRGDTSFNPIEEKYIKFGLGITINDRWFIKPKYD